jgi:Sulfotransferase family
MAGSPTAQVAAPRVPQVPAPPGRDPRRHAPVIVLSPSRSYSSVVTTMIGCHPELYGFPELLLWTAATVSEVLADPVRGGSPAAPAFPAGLVRALAELHDGAQGPDEAAAAQAWLLARQSWPACDVHDHLLDLVAPRRGVEKTPQTAVNSDALERVARAYPVARFIHLTRHPATALPSLNEHWLWSRRMQGMTTDLPQDEARWQWVECAASWLVAHWHALEFGARAGQDRVLRVRGEDVLADPRLELTRIARWLEISADPAAVGAMLHPERGVFAGHGPPGASGGNDRKFLDQPVPRAVRCPPGHRLPASIQLGPGLVTKVESLAAKLGY